MKKFEKLYEQTINLFDESNTAGAGGVFGDTADASPKTGDYEINYAEEDNRNIFGTPEKKGKKKKKKKSKFPWLQKRNLSYN